MKKVLYLLMALFCVMASFAACGNDEQAEPDSSALPNASESSEVSVEESGSEAESYSEAESASEEESTSEEESAFDILVLVGEWADGCGDNFIFAEDGTGKVVYEGMGELNIVWSATADTISISMDFDGQWADYCKDTPYTVNDDELSFTVHGAELIFKRK